MATRPRSPTRLCSAAELSGDAADQPARYKRKMLMVEYPGRPMPPEFPNRPTRPDYPPHPQPGYPPRPRW